MKKIKYYKHCAGYDEQRGGYYHEILNRQHGYHFEAAEGYLIICPNGLRVAVERQASGVWRATELSTGMAFCPDAHTRKELVDNIYSYSDAVIKALQSGNEWTVKIIEKLRAYTEQQQALFA